MIPKEILKKIRHIQIRTRHMVNDIFAGQYQSVFKGQGMEFQEVREYYPGDEIRSIDWNVTARMGHPYVKKFVEERECTVMLVVDVSGSNRFGSTSQLKKDLAAELAAVLAFSAIRNNDRVGLVLFTDQVERYVPPKKGVRHVLRVIREVLYSQPEHRETRIEPALNFLHHITRRKAVVFLISDFLFRDDAEGPLSITARKHDTIAMLVSDKREQAWPRTGLVEWEDAESGRRFLIDAAHGGTRRALSRQETRRRQELLKKLHRLGIDTVELYAGESYEKELFKFFRMREQRLRT